MSLRLLHFLRVYLRVGLFLLSSLWSLLVVRGGWVRLHHLSSWLTLRVCALGVDVRLDDFYMGIVTLVFVPFSTVYSG